MVNSLTRDHQALKTEIEKVYSEICEAFSRLDFDAVLDHFADEGMVKISQGVVLRGKQQLAENWRQRIGDVKQLRIRIENIEVHGIDDRHAWTTADETISIDGQRLEAVVSNIFVLLDSGWKILLDHTSYVQTENQSE
jgi:uncharacterized protein (TIGR02246 family)